MGAKSVFSASTIEEKGYATLFQDGQVFFMPIGSISDTIVVLELERERKKGQPMQAMTSRNRVTKNREQTAPKVV
jgi:hypothetical protein